MAIYLATLGSAASGGRTLIENTDAAIVHAADEAAAEAYMVELYGAIWNNCTITAVPAAPVADGWTLTVEVEGMDAVSVTGDATVDTVDELAAAMVIALNATDEISNASYNSSTNVLTAAAIADALGDMALTVTLTDAAGNDRSDLLGAIVDEGIEGAVLTVELPADAALAGIWRRFRQV